MKEHLSLITLVTGCFVLNSQSAIINGGFETGTTAGWELQGDMTYMAPVIPDDVIPNLFHYGIVEYPFEPITNPLLAHAASVTTSWNPYFLPIAPIEGSYLLALSVPQVPSARFIGPDGVEYEVFPPYSASLSQTVALHAGDRVSGWAAYGTDENYPHGDPAFIRIGDDLVWAGTPQPLGPHGRTSDWQEWSWTAPDAGNYIISLGVRGDEEMTSWALIDGITIHTTPETLNGMGLALLLGLTSFAMIGGASRRKKANRTLLWDGDVV